MTASEAYTATLKAKRDYVLAAIKSSVRNCIFEVEVWYTYLYDELEDELKSLGYVISRNDRSRVRISWENPATAFNQ